METHKFKDSNLSPKEIIDNLEAECYTVEEAHNFLKPFTEEEFDEVKDMFLEKQQGISKLKKEMEPIRLKMKPLEKESKLLLEKLNLGGENVTEKVYLFPDYTTRQMHIYDSRGVLIKTRPMNRAEKQLSFNAERHLNKAM